MKYIVTALHSEARSLIQNHSLKQDAASRRLPLYSNEDTVLIVSGVGPVAASIATTFLLNTFAAQATDTIINLGYCGSAGKEAETGELFLINRITSASSGRSFFPEILSKHTFKEQAAVTVERPVKTNDSVASLYPNALFEMEAAGFFQAASLFLPLQNIQVLKMVSDHLEGQLLDKAKLENQLTSHLPAIEEYCTSLGELPSTAIPQLDDVAKQFLDHTVEVLSLTETQRHQLKNALLAFSINRDVKELKAFEQYFEPKPKHKQERNVRLNCLISALRKVVS